MTASCTSKVVSAAVVLLMGLTIAPAVWANDSSETVVHDTAKSQRRDRAAWQPLFALKAIEGPAARENSVFGRAWQKQLSRDRRSVDGARRIWLSPAAMTYVDPVFARDWQRGL